MMWKFFPKLSVTRWGTPERSAKLPTALSQDPRIPDATAVLRQFELFARNFQKDLHKSKPGDTMRPASQKSEAEISEMCASSSVG